MIALVAALALMSPPPGVADRAVLSMESQHAAVYYATSGPAAPPLDDANVDGIPDYVESVAGAVDRAFEMLPHFGIDFVADARLVVLIRQLEPGVDGEMLMESERPLVTVSNALVRDRFVERVVAHEVVHVAQTSIGSALPAWIAEGTASALAARIVPEALDANAARYQRAWLLEPWRSLDDEARGCERCYGGAVWWSYLLDSYPLVVSRLYAKLAQPGGGMDHGRRALREVFSESGLSLSSVFSDFATRLLNERPRPRVERRLGSAVGPPRLLRVNRLAMRYLPVVFNRPSQVSVSTAGSAVDVAVRVNGRPGRVVQRHQLQAGRAVTIGLRKNVTLVFTHAGTRPAAVRVSVKR